EPFRLLGPAPRAAGTGHAAAGYDIADRALSAGDAIKVQVGRALIPLVADGNRIAPPVAALLEATRAGVHARTGVWPLSVTIEDLPPPSPPSAFRIMAFDRARPFVEVDAATFAARLG